ncbi:Green heme protein [Methylophilaceae bacterium]|nr:Green heme protein [Methylophilaceae bacterium]
MQRYFIMLTALASAMTAIPAIGYAAESIQPQMPRGELLYRNHCIECHTQQIHWREKRIATDLNSLSGQVNRWQDAIGLHWTKDEIDDVSRYLNSTYYFY